MIYQLLRTRLPRAIRRREQQSPLCCASRLSEPAPGADDLGGGSDAGRATLSEPKKELAVEPANLSGRPMERP